MIIIFHDKNNMNLSFQKTYTMQHRLKQTYFFCYVWGFLGDLWTIFFHMKMVVVLLVHVSFHMVILEFVHMVILEYSVHMVTLEFFVHMVILEYFVHMVTLEFFVHMVTLEFFLHKEILEI